MRRVSVIGSSASGKTTVGRALANRLKVPHLELDSIFHLEGWTQKADPLFRSEVAEFVDQDRWVVDGNYTSHGVADIVWPKADTIVWLDPSKARVMSRAIRRTLRRVITREELWNGNREPWTNLYSRDPDENIILWAWTRFDRTRARYERMLTDGTWAHLAVHRLRSPWDVTTFLGRATSGKGSRSRPSDHDRQRGRDKS